MSQVLINFPGLFINEVIPKLYIGSTLSRHPYLLKKYGIKNIVTANIEPREKGYNNITLNWKDSPDQKLMPEIERAYKFIDRYLSKGEKVLVHCTMGLSRSASVIIYYLMKKFKLSYKQAHSILKKSRMTFLNSGFKKQLKNFKFA